MRTDEPNRPKTSLEVSRTADGQLMVKLKASNGRVLMQSECYKSLEAAERLMDIVQEMYVETVTYKKDVHNEPKTDRSMGGGKKKRERGAVLPDPLGTGSGE
jgi:uncharacterized protein YegP (UPF0339 family)